MLELPNFDHMNTPTIQFECHKILLVTPTKFCWLFSITAAPIITSSYVIGHKAILSIVSDKAFFVSVDKWSISNCSHSSFLPFVFFV